MLKKALEVFLLQEYYSVKIKQFKKKSVVTVDQQNKNIIATFVAKFVNKFLIELKC